MTAADELSFIEATSYVLKVLSLMVDEIIEGINPPKEYCTSEEISIWIHGTLDVRDAIKKALLNVDKKRGEVI
jgi:5-methylcytosine-specific restriction endonuclease McrBC regulatory subunit McrC